MQCPSILGNGATTQRLYCDVLGGTDPAAAGFASQLRQTMRDRII
jgi:hypothetical protein